MNDMDVSCELYLSATYDTSKGLFIVSSNKIVGEPIGGLFLNSPPTGCISNCHCNCLYTSL